MDDKGLKKPEKKAVGGQTKDCDINPMEKLGYNQAIDECTAYRKQKLKEKDERIEELEKDNKDLRRQHKSWLMDKRHFAETYKELSKLKDACKCRLL